MMNHKPCPLLPKTATTEAGVALLRVSSSSSSTSISLSTDSLSSAYNSSTDDEIISIQNHHHHHGGINARSYCCCSSCRTCDSGWVDDSKHQRKKGNLRPSSSVVVVVGTMWMRKYVVRFSLLATVALVVFQWSDLLLLRQTNQQDQMAGGGGRFRVTGRDHRKERDRMVTQRKRHRTTITTTSTIATTVTQRNQQTTQRENMILQRRQRSDPPMPKPQLKTPRVRHIYTVPLPQSHVFSLNDFQDLKDEDIPEQDNVQEDKSWSEAASKRQPILKLLTEAGLNVELPVLQALPTWDQVTSLYGDGPVIIGKDTCERFRAKVPAENRFVGVAGQMNTGTNALAKYFMTNLRIEENQVLKGVLWTVPWNKHGWVKLRGRYRYKLPHQHQNVMPVILIRDPYFWMKSMCESPYTMEWNRTDTHCPNLVEESTMFEYQSDDTANSTAHLLPVSMGNPVNIQWAVRYIRQWPSLAHVWSGWYREYYEAEFPRLMIRFEDLLFYPEQIMDEIRQCVGAVWKHDEFVFQTNPAKVHPYFEKYKKQSGFVSALIKYGQDDKLQRIDNMTDEDLTYARQYIDADLMTLFNYQQPMSAVNDDNVW